MFTGFASENTPAIQVWDFFRTFANTSAVRSVSLADDCAPIQVFRTGATGIAIRVYLPTAPIEGKQITIVNQRYGFQTQSITIYSSDVSGFGTNTGLPIITLGQGDSITLVYSKQCISNGTSSGYLETGWLSLNRASITAANYGSAIVGGDANSATTAYCFVGGGSSNTASGGSSAVVGGSSSTASGSNAAVVGGSSNSAINTYAAVVGGSVNAASGNSSAVVGGTSNSASSTNAAVVGGSSNSASGIGGAIVAGSTNIANSDYGVVIGGSRGDTRGISGNFVTPASNNPVSNAGGAQQLATLLLGRQTTDATATRLTSNTSGASTTNQVILPNNSAYYVKGSIIATVTGGGNTKSWDFIATIKRGANAASTSIVGAVTLNVQAADAGAATWIVAITADTTNGGLAVTVTGQAATTIRWVAKLESTEVTY